MTFSIYDAICENDLAIALLIVRRLLRINGDGMAHIWMDCIAEKQWQYNIGNTRGRLLGDYVTHEMQFLSFDDNGDMACPR